MSSEDDRPAGWSAIEVGCPGAQRLLLLIGLFLLGWWGTHNLTRDNASDTAASSSSEFPEQSVNSAARESPQSMENGSGGQQQEPSPTPSPLALPIPLPTLEPEPRFRSVVPGMLQVYIPAGPFLMGSTQQDIALILDDCSDCERGWFEDQLPQQEVYLDAYWIDQTEVTNLMYSRCVLDGACSPPFRRSSYGRSSYFGDTAYDNYPVIFVRWDDAATYCAWAGMRLPTEAEWEKAARGTEGQIYPWGDDSPRSRQANFARQRSDTTEVGSYPAGSSPFDVLDMSGNVWEWVADWYDSETRQSQQALRNPHGPSTGSERVLKGGSWYDGGWSIGAAFRLNRSPDFKGNSVGFRCSAAP